MSLRRRVLATALLTSVIGASSALAGGGPAARATTPDFFRFPIEEHDPMLEPESSTCGFPISSDVSGEIRVHVHYDAQGNPTRLDVWGNKTGTLSANGIQLRVFSNDHKFFDLTTQTMTELGVVFRYSGPRVGVVLMDRGRLVWNVDENGEMVGDPIFEAGPHPELHGDFRGLCAALTP
jgi:hypothetical protein